MSADSRSRTLPPTRDTSASVEARLSGRLTFGQHARSIPARVQAQSAAGPSPWATWLWRDSRQPCSRSRHPSSASSARRTREIMVRSDPRDVLRALDISAQPEDIVGHAARHRASRPGATPPAHCAGAAC